MPVTMWMRGTVYGAAALVSGYWGLRAVFTPLPSGRFFWWPLIAFGASILLLIGGVWTVFPQLRKRWLVALAGTIALVVWAAFVREFSVPYLVFGLVLVLVAWAVLAIASVRGKTETVAFVASLTLSIIWLPASIYSLRATLSTIPPANNALVLGPLLVLWALLAASFLVSGFASLRTRST